MEYRIWRIKAEEPGFPFGNCIGIFEGVTPVTALRAATKGQYGSLFVNGRYLVASVSRDGGNHEQFGIFDVAAPTHAIVTEVSL